MFLLPTLSKREIKAWVKLMLKARKGDGKPTVGREHRKFMQGWIRKLLKKLRHPYPFGRLNRKGW